MRPLDQRPSASPSPGQPDSGLPLTDAVGRAWTRAIWLGDPGKVDRPAVRTALARASAHDRPKAELLSDAFEAMAMAHQSSLPGVVAHLESVLSRARALDWAPAVHLASAALAAALFRLPERHADALALVADPEAEGGADDTNFARVWIDTQATIVMAALRQVDEGLRRAMRAHHLAQALEEPVLMARCARAMAFLLLTVGDVDAALIAIDREVAALDRASLPVPAHTLYNKGLALLVSGRDDELLTLTRGPAWSDSLIEARTRASLDRLLACALARSGRPDEAIQLLESSRIQDRPSEYNVEVNGVWMVATVLLAAGRPAPSRELMERMSDDWRAGDTRLSPMNATQALSVLSEAREACGDLSGALEALRMSQAACRNWVAASVRAQLIQTMQSPTKEQSERITRRLRVLDERLQASEAPAGPALADPAPTVHPTGRRLVAEVAHEIRTPLNGMIGLTSMLALSKLDEKQRQYVELTQTSAQMLLRLCNGLLDLSQMDAGHFRLNLAATDLASVIRDALQLMRPLSDLKPSLALKFEVDPLLPAQCIVDGQRVQQILLNLVGNAIKFTDRGEVRVSLTWVPDSAMAELGMVVMEVRDTGIGFDPAEGQKLFGEFEQLDTPQRAQGTGLGLALSRRLAEQMGGRLRAKSTKGSGSTFRLEVPLRAAVGEAVSPA